MNQELLQVLKQNIECLIKDNVLLNSEIFLFGMNAPGDRVIQFLESNDYRVRGILDNNINNQGKFLMGVPVFAPDYIKQFPKEFVKVLICSKYYGEMKEQLEKFGLKEKKNIFKILEMNASVVFSTDERYLEQATHSLVQSITVYESIKKPYKADTLFLLCPIKANGDMYMSAALVQQYSVMNRGASVVLVLVGNIGKKIALMFGVENVLLVSQQEMEALTNVVTVFGSKKTNMTIIHPEIMHFNIFKNMECFKGLNFADFICCGALGMKKEKHTFTRKSLLREETIPIFDKKDVVLAPYANSLPSLPGVFWTELVKSLQENGYHVYTNSGGDMEPPIVGTEPIFLPIETMSEELNCCAAFISLRNGLCDVVASSLCRKIIIYPQKGMGFGMVKDFYGLNDMGLCNDAIELEYCDDILESILDYVLNTT